MSLRSKEKGYFISRKKYFFWIEFCCFSSIIIIFVYLFVEISLVRALLVRVSCSLLSLCRPDNKHRGSFCITINLVYWDVLNLSLNLELLTHWLTILQELPCFSLSRDGWHVHPSERDGGGRWELFMWEMGIELHSSSLWGEHFTHWANSWTWSEKILCSNLLFSWPWATFLWWPILSNTVF